MGILILAATAIGGPSAVSARVPLTCHVRNPGIDESYSSLQRAVDAARRSDRLTVTGICLGSTLIDKDLVIEGIRTPDSGAPTLSGAGRDRVVKIEPGASVTLQDLLIVRGLARWGGGIKNDGSLVLRDVVVRRCEGRTWKSTVGGIYNSGRLRLDGASSIRANGTGWDDGYGPGGVWNTGTFIMSGSSSISESWTGWGSGSGVWNTGKFIMNGSSSISGSADFGAQNDGTFRMNASSSIHDNPGGVRNEGSFTMNDSSSINGNAGADMGVGIINLDGSRLTMNDHSTVRGNGLSADGGVYAVAGGGVAVGPGAVFTMNDHSTIRRNAAYGNGGGVFVAPGGLLAMNDGASIAVNSAGLGGGVYLSVRTKPRPAVLVLRDSSTIRNNQANEGKAGGVHVGAGVLKGAVCGTGRKIRGNAPDDCYDP